MVSVKTTTILPLVAFLVIFQAALVKSDKKYQCNGHEITISDKKLEGMKKCGEQVGVKAMEEMTPEKLPCFMKCAMESAELVDAEGKPHKENIMKSIDEGVPAEMQTAYKAAVEKCIDEHGHHISPKDQTCLSYNPLAMCVTVALKAICHG